jgi:broad specificity phosphatase PhoE
MVSEQEQGQMLWLVQHGQTTWNSLGWVQGQVDRARFTRLGRQQIRRVADHFVEQPVSAVYSSDLWQARRTAMAIAHRLRCGVLTDRRLRERSFGMAEGLPWADVPSVVTGIVGGCVVDEMARPPGGETLHELYARCRNFLLDVANGPREGAAVVVAHDGSIQMLRAIVGDSDLLGLSWEPSPKCGEQPIGLRLPQFDTAS